MARNDGLGQQMKEGCREHVRQAVWKTSEKRVQAHRGRRYKGHEEKNWHGEKDPKKKPAIKGIRTYSKKRMREHEKKKKCHGGSISP